MRRIFEVDGRNLCSVKESLTAVSYSGDYVTRLAREGKIFAKLVGRQWFVDLDSLRTYESNSRIEQVLKSRHMSEDLRKEHQVRESVNAKLLFRIEKAQSTHKKAMLTAVCVLMFGLSFGYMAYDSSPYSQRIFDVRGIRYNLLSSIFNSQKDTTNFSEKVKPNDSFSKTEFYMMDSPSDGILLFPFKNGSSTNIESFFSDRVEVVEINNGSAIVRVDKNGRKTDHQIPYVVVPVNQD